MPQIPAVNSQIRNEEHVTVLIVEDHAGVRRLLRDALREVAAQVWECENGAEALAAYPAHRPDVVLMDLSMPVLDGLAATRQIRHLHLSARIVIVTDYDDEGLRDAAREAGACGYVLKDNLLEIVPQLRRALQNRFTEE